MDINNGLTIQFGHGEFYGSNINTHTPYEITLPISVNQFNVAVINAGVGTSGWQYTNGICVTAATPSTFSGFHALGLSGLEPYTYIDIGY